MSDSFFEAEEMNKNQGFSLDFKRVLSRAIRFWYVIILGLIVSLTIAFYKNRYSKRVYMVTASVIIRETQEIGGAEILYKNPLIDPYRNYLNEPYIIKSYPLIEKVVRDLNFHVSFLQKGYVITSEVYSTLPVKAVWCSNKRFKEGKLSFVLLDEHRFQLSTDLENPQNNSKAFNFNDTIEFNDFHLCVYRIPERKLRSMVGIPLILQLENPTSVAGSYIARLNVQWAEEGSGVINLSITGSNPDKEIDFLKAMIATYQEVDLKKKNEAATRTVAFISRQLLEIKDSLRLVEFQLERFGNGSSVKDLSSEAERLFRRIESFELQQAELLIRQNYFQYLDEYLNRESDRLEQVILPSSMGISDPILGSILSNMIETQMEVKLYMNPTSLENPLLKEKIKQIGQIKRDIKEALQTLRSTDKIKMDFLLKQIKDVEKQLGKIPASERQLIAVQRNYALLENLYVFLMQKYSESRISEAANTSDIFPVNPPMRGAAISPKTGQNYTIALLLGFAIPITLFVLFELINNRVQSKEDIDKLTSIPFLGGVGHSASGNNLTVIDRPKSGVAESFRALRSNLNYFTANKDKQIFMVSSSISGEGKTFTSINLATVFALSGKKTLIVGADMRRPKIFEDFRCNNGVGLSTYLSGINSFPEVIQQTKIANLFLISGGPVPPNPSELLLTDRFKDFINYALENFDFVIIDTPPLALVTDAFVISKFVNHTVFVLRQNYSPKDFVRSIDEYYRNGKLKNMSIMLNDIYKSGLGYGYGQGYAYNYGYSYGYGYGNRRKGGNGYYED